VVPAAGGGGCTAVASLMREDIAGDRGVAGSVNDGVDAGGV
jgi:hypothetical protein